ncbi:MAG: bifunctional phosphopantothenoylcysteine decarboxylase/phosphopantothenate--cysteine ligase CoaBC [Fusobacteriaceae bacterium]
MKNILLGVTGGIAAYKSAGIVSLLMKKGYNVKVVMTESATKFITPLTLETLSRNRVSTDMWTRDLPYEIEHISLATWADIILVAPATYNFVGKISSGIADDLLSTIISATKAKVFFALAMNVVMYENPIIKENIDKLEKFGYNFIDSDEGMLACNVRGKGRLKNELDIVEIVDKYLTAPQVEGNFLAGKKILITAGRTEEAIDPIRYISNLSSGKMGYSLAKACSDFGGDVTLISGPTNLEQPKDIKKFIKVRSAVQMFEATLKEFQEADIIIGCAAVADYRPKNYSDQKIKKSDGDLVIEFERNPDILKTLGENKGSKILIGFAAETKNIMENAKSKYTKKNLDFIIANSAGAMGKDENSVTIIKKSGDTISLESKSKEKLAYEIIEEIFAK